MSRNKKVTVPALLKYKSKNKKIVMTTAYDATMARIVDNSDIDVLLVGDSLGMVVQGHSSTIPVTLDDIIYHSSAVARVVKRVHVCADMPFMANKVTPSKTVEDAANLIQKGSAESVKIEGGVRIAKTIEMIVSAGIPVVGHVGLTPQSVHAFGGFKIQGKSEADKNRIIEDALCVQESGAFMIVLEGMPANLAREITSQLKIPTIGIGAGPDCDGQVLVSNDLLGLDPGFNPKFVKKYANIGEHAGKAFAAYTSEVREGVFPEQKHSTFVGKK